MTLDGSGGTVVKQVGQQLTQPLRTKQPLRQRIDHDGFECLIAHAGAGAGGLAAAQTARTAVVAIAAALTRRDGQRMTAVGLTTFRDPGEHGWSRDERRRRYVAGVASDSGLNLKPVCFWNDDGDMDSLPLLLGASEASPCIDYSVIMDPALCAASQYVIDAGDVELAAAQCRTVGIEVRDDLLIAHRSLAGADALHTIDLLNL